MSGIGTFLTSNQKSSESDLYIILVLLESHMKVKTHMNPYLHSTFSLTSVTSSVVLGSLIFLTGLGGITSLFSGLER